MKGLIFSFCSKRLVAVLHLDRFHHTIDENHTHTNRVCKITKKHSSKASFKFKRMGCHFFFFPTFIFIALPLPHYLRDICKTTSKHSSKASFKLTYMGCHFFNFYFHFYSSALTPLSERYTQNHKQALIKSKLQACELFFCFCFSPFL